MTCYDYVFRLLSCQFLLYLMPGSCNFKAVETWCTAVLFELFVASFADRTPGEAKDEVRILRKGTASGGKMMILNDEARDATV